MSYSNLEQAHTFYNKKSINALCRESSNRVPTLVLVTAYNIKDTVHTTVPCMCIKSSSFFVASIVIFSHYTLKLAGPENPTACA